jgi:tetratricopeptide (TPR) repeat protein
MNAKLFRYALLAVSVSACAQSPVLETPVVSAPEPEGRGLTSQVLYQFLLGEIASQRGELQLSAEAYADLATRTRDARVARRATEVALYARQTQLALKNARLWRELEPASPKAMQTLASLLVGSGRLGEAKPHLHAWIKTGKEGEVFMQLHGLLAKQKDRQAVLDLVTDLAASYPGMPEARFAVGQAAWQAGQGRKALAALDEALRLRPDWESTALFKAQVLQREDGDAALESFLKDYLAAHPAAREVRLAYARQLARVGKFTESRAQFEFMTRENPDNPEAHFAVGLVALQTNDLDSAKASFLKALDLGHPDEGQVRFYLGQLAEARNLPEEALTWYQSVSKGRQQFDARLRAAVMMNKLGRLAEARAWLAALAPSSDSERIQLAQTEAQLLREAKNFDGVFDVLSAALEKMPDAPELLYDRAMAAEKINRLDVLEKDLRRLIQLKPDHAHAYNALGYTLADRTTRIKEAIELLERALKLEPEDPFILDSMGWAMFKAKRYAEAVDYLRRAFGIRPDPEIAAHFGEALWMKGDKEEARRVWRNGLQLHPDNESLREVASRLMR